MIRKIWRIIVLISIAVVLAALARNYLEWRTNQLDKERWLDHAGQHCIDIGYLDGNMWMCLDGIVYRRR